MVSPGKSWHRMLAVMLMSSLPAAAWVLSRDQAAGDSGNGFPERAAGPVAAKAAGPAAENPEIGRIGREPKPAPDNVAVTDIFERQSWEGAAPAEAASTPMAPPLPFTYMGKIVENGRETVFLTRQDRSYAAKVGETLDGVYRVEKIRPSTVTFTYLPLDQRQQLATGE